MIKLNKNMKSTAFLLVLNSLMLFMLEGVEAGDKGDDIIMTKGKLIVRGGKGKGSLILDTGSKSNDHHEMMPMMPLMGHHFNPYSFYPMPPQHHQQHQPPMVIHPVYMEDHSAMHHQPEQQHEYHHEEPHYQHHEMQYHEMHHEPQHHEMHHEPQHHEMHHEPEQHEMHHYEPEVHHEEEGHHGGYENHPMMSMMMHGSGSRPVYQHLAALQAAAQNPANFALHLQTQSFPGQQQQMDIRQHQQAQQQKHHQEQHQHQQQQQQHQPQQAMASEQQNKKSSLLDQASNNPLAAFIRPLFNRSPTTQKKP